MRIENVKSLQSKVPEKFGLSQQAKYTKYKEESASLRGNRYNRMETNIGYVNDIHCVCVVYYG